MSKDKGTKNLKKAPTDKLTANKKVSSYKSESKSDQNRQPPIEAFTPKTDQKSSGNNKR